VAATPIEGTSRLARVRYQRGTNPYRLLAMRKRVEATVLIRGVVVTYRRPSGTVSSVLPGETLGFGCDHGRRQTHPGPPYPKLAADVLVVDAPKRRLGIIA